MLQSEIPSTRLVHSSGNNNFALPRILRISGANKVNFGDEKLAFAELAERMIEADGLVIGREKAALASLKAEMGTPSEAIGGRSVDELAGTFKSWRSKVAALLELLGLGYSDTSFSIGEQSLILRHISYHKA